MVTNVYEKGTDSTDTAAWNKVDKINNSDVDFAYVNVSPSFNIQMKDEVNLYDINDTIIFAGYVRSIKNQTLKETIVFGYDILLSDIEIQKNFQNYSPEGIIQYCVELAGMTYVSTISSGLTIELYPAKDKKLKDIIDDMHNILGTVGRVDNSKNYYLEYPGATFNTITLEVGTNCELDNGWNLDTEHLCTQVKVIGALENVQLDPVTFSGTGSQTDFELNDIFKTVKVEVDSGSGFVEQTPQISGVQTGDYEILKEIKLIRFVSGSIPPSGTDNVRITYTYDRQIEYTEASEIIASDKSNLHQKTLKREYLKTIEDVEAYAGDFLDKFSQPLINGVIRYNTLNINLFNINQSIQVIDNTRKVNGSFVNKTMVIKRIIREFGAEGADLLIEVGENTDFSFNRAIEQEYRIKQLEENITTSELLQFGIKTTDSLTMQFDSDFSSIVKRTYASDTFYLEENASGTRNQMVEAGTGPVMREVGYTETALDVQSYVLIDEDDNTLTTEGGVILLTEQLNTVNDGVVTATYMNNARNSLFNQFINNISHIAVGDDNTTPVVTDTSLGNQTYIESATVTQSGLSITSKTVLEITENNGNTVKELGIFDRESLGNMYTRTLTTVVDKDSDTVIRLSNILTLNTQNTNL